MDDWTQWDDWAQYENRANVILIWPIGIIGAKCDDQAQCDDPVQYDNRANVIIGPNVTNWPYAMWQMTIRINVTIGPNVVIGGNYTIIGYNNRAAIESLIAWLVKLFGAMSQKGHFFSMVGTMQNPVNI